MVEVALLILGLVLAYRILQEPIKHLEYIHIQARRGSESFLDRYVGKYNEIALDTTTWKLRRFDGLTPGGTIFGGRDLYDYYKQNESLYFTCGKDSGKCRLGGKKGYKFICMTDDENKKYVGKHGEIIDVTDKKQLFAHDGETPGGFPL